MEADREKFSARTSTAALPTTAGTFPLWLSPFHMTSAPACMAAHKRKAQEAFGLSAFAAARLPAQSPESLAAEAIGDVLSDDDDEQAGRPRPNVQLSSFSPDAVVSEGDSIEVTLQAQQNITLIGEYDISVVRGLVSIYGSILHPASGPQRVHALSISALPSTTAIKDAALIRVSSLSAESRVTRLGKCSPLFRGIGVPDDTSRRSFVILEKSSDDPLHRTLVPLEIDEDTKKILSRFNSRLTANEVPRVMAVGPKSSGKSTFSRILCNIITSRPNSRGCLYLDLDPGQPEFGPPGQISLVEVVAPIFGPSLTHPASVKSKKHRLIRSHTLAAVSLKDDPELYIRSVKDLMKYVSKHLPLVVNSCGWVNGVGANAILDLVEILSLTDVPILHPIDSGLEEQLRAQTTAHHIRRKQSRGTLKAPAELRAMQTMAYFHHRYSHSGNLTWRAKLIEEMRTWIVDYTSKSRGVATILSYGEMPYPDFFHEVINGAVVAIVVLNAEHPELSSILRTEADGLPHTLSQAEQCSPPVSPQHSQCVGLALVRGIDAVAKKLQLIAPLTNSQIAGVRNRRVVLVRGGFDSPDWAYLEAIYAGDEGKFLTGNLTRPWVSFSDPVGIEGSVWRLRHPPMAVDVRSVQ